jgi:hypothetical protein
MGVYSITEREATRLSTMITLLSVDAGRSNLRTQARIHRRELRRRLRRIHQRLRQRIRIQREDAIISYLSARRFPPKSKEALILRMLAQTAVHRMKKLESVLNHSAETTKPQPRRWLLDWRCFLRLAYSAFVAASMAQTAQKLTKTDRSQRLILL